MRWTRTHQTLECVTVSSRQLSVCAPGEWESDGRDRVACGYRLTDSKARVCARDTVCVHFWYQFDFCELRISALRTHDSTVRRGQSNQPGSVTVVFSLPRVAGIQLYFTLQPPRRALRALRAPALRALRARTNGCLVASGSGCTERNVASCHRRERQP